MKTIPGPFLVIHPDGDTRRLCVVNAKSAGYRLYDGLILATRNLFEDSQHANTFAADLASHNSIAAAQVMFA